MQHETRNHKGEKTEKLQSRNHVLVQASTQVHDHYKRQNKIRNKQ